MREASWGAKSECEIFRFRELETDETVIVRDKERGKWREIESVKDKEKVRDRRI